MRLISVASPPPTSIQAMTPAVPFRRMGTAEEVSAAVVFLLSMGAAYTSGATLLVVRS